MQSSTVKTKFGAVEYKLQGKLTQPVCLVLHGGHSNCFEQLGVSDILAAGYAALIPSRPGYGKTSAHAKTAEDAAAMFVEFLDVFEIKQVVVLAISAGGPTGLYLAANYPERVKTVVLESAVSKRWLTPDDQTYQVGKRIFHPSMERFTWAMLRIFVKPFPKMILAQMMSSFTSLKTKDVLAELDDDDIIAFQTMIKHQASGQGFMLDLEHDITSDVLAKITAPVLIVHSKHDNAVPFEHAEHTKAYIAKAELYEAPSWGHLIWLGQHKKDIGKKVRGFLMLHQPII